MRAKDEMQREDNSGDESTREIRQVRQGAEQRKKIKKEGIQWDINGSKEHRVLEN